MEQVMTVTTSATTKLLTADDLMRLDSRGVHGELIRGEFHETMPARKFHSKVAAKIIYLLMTFVYPKKLGTVMSTELGVWLERDPDTVRAPDVAFFSIERMSLDDEDPAFSNVVPDLVVEVASPNDTLRSIHEKCLMWTEFGALLVWSVHPSTRTVNVYQADGSFETFGMNDSIDGGEVLPGFSCEVRDVFG